MNLKQKLYSVRDQKADAYNLPFGAPNAAHAIRSFTDAARRGDSLMKEHPEDFFLFQVGEFDLETGEITADKQSLGCALDFIGGEE